MSFTAAMKIDFQEIMSLVKKNSNIPSKLNHFNSHREFSEYCQSLFELKTEEYKDLYHVLLKLQGMGEDPKAVLKSWKEASTDEESIELIRFMIRINNMDVDGFMKAA